MANPCDETQAEGALGLPRDYFEGPFLENAACLYLSATRKSSPVICEMRSDLSPCSTWHARQEYEPRPSPQSCQGPVGRTWC